MNEDCLNKDEYLKKILELEKILSEEKAQENDDNEEIKNKKFKKKIDDLKIKQQKELEILNEGLSKLQNNPPNDIINIESIQDLQTTTINKVNEQLNNYFVNNNKSLKDKINEYFNKEFNSILTILNNNNDNILNDFINKQTEIIKSLNSIKKDLKIEDIDNRDNNNNLNNSNDIKNNKENNENNNEKRKDKNNQDNLLRNNAYKNNEINQFININKDEKNLMNDQINKTNNEKQYFKENNNIIQNNVNYEGPQDVKENIIKMNNNNNIEEEDIPEDEIEDINNSQKINTFVAKSNVLRELGKDKNKNNIHNSYNMQNFITKDKNEEKPTQIKQNEIFELPPQNQKMNPKTTIQKIQKPRKLYKSMKKYFFNDYEQKFLKIQKISDVEKEEIDKELVNAMKNGDSTLRRYCINFIEANVLPFFKRKDLADAQRDILKYNVETIAQCCGLEKNTYRNYYYPEIFHKKKVIDRGKSVEALKKFRMEFNVSEKDYNDEGIIKRLEENNLDIYKTFQKIFGL